MSQGLEPCTKKSILVVLGLLIILPLLNCGGSRGSKTVTPPPPPGCTNTATISCTQYGQVQGVVQGNVRAFRNIPYAAPPTGTLRWKPPTAPASWTGVRDGSTLGNMCPQLNGSTYFGSEDCLYLNVYTSSPAPTTPQPVMVFIHYGGNFADDTTTPRFDAPALAANGAVVVWINYRLGILGFLASPELTSEGGGTSGNYALLDMIAALTWVKNNISNFGGDPTHVLLWGQSAGGWDIQALLAAPSAQGLFSAAAIESGVLPSTNLAVNVPSFTAAQNAGESFVSAEGCSSSSASTALSCLRTLTPQTLVNYQVNHPLPMAPLYGSPLLPTDSFTVLQNSGSPVPLIIGSTREEYANSGDNPVTEANMTSSQYASAVQSEFGSNASTVESDYPVSNYSAPIYALIAVDSDYNVTCQTRNVARAASGSGRSPVWRYLYTHTFEADANLALGRAFHGAELYFIFGKLSVIDPGFIPAVNPYNPTTAEQGFSQDMMGYWIRFAATGNPNGNGAANWPQYDASTDDMLQLDDTFVTINGYNNSQCDFLSTLPQFTR